MKQLIERYYHPTPKKWRKLGDSILAGCLLITSGTLMAFDEMQEIFSVLELKIIMGSLIGVGFLAKVVTNFFKDEETNDTTPSP